jgi:hypothetical protein
VPIAVILEKYPHRVVPSIVDFTMVDTNKDAAIDANEFKAGCAAGWIAPAS